MTINHVFLRVSVSNFAATRAFYTRALAPLGYKEMFPVSSTYVGIGSDYPYLWLKALPEGQKSVPTHIAFDAPSTSLRVALNIILTPDETTSRWTTSIH